MNQNDTYGLSYELLGFASMSIYMLSGFSGIHWTILDIELDMLADACNPQLPMTLAGTLVINMNMMFTQTEESLS